MYQYYVYMCYICSNACTIRYTVICTNTVDMYIHIDVHIMYMLSCLGSSFG